MVLVEAHGGGETGLGYTYGDVAAGTVIESVLRGVVAGRDAMAVRCGLGGDGPRAAVTSAAPGVASMAIAAVDTALWDLKARLLGLPLGDAARRRCARPCRSTAAAASPRIPTSGSPSSSAAGRRWASRA